MKALTIRQPWAWAIVHAGKDIENRNWPTKYRGQIAIHAAKGLTRTEYAEMVDYIQHHYKYKKEIPSYEKMIRGAIVGVADLIDCVPSSKSKWFEGEYGFVLKNVRPITPIVCSGALGFWNMSDDIMKKLNKKYTTKAERWKTLMGNKVEHFVAYHSTALMGYPLELNPKEFSWYSRKSPNFLEKTIGNKVWMIMGTKVGKRTKYELMGYYFPHEIDDSEKGVYVVRGNEGKIIVPSILDDYAWFLELLKIQNKFSFGLSRIHQDEIIAALEKIAK
jgi:hypothetical protein